ncbi:hypothetical protein SAMN05192550_0513 [Flavobacterium glycines]|uniref:tRNA_anti-like n=1 Tax=Flavobacterium glycines TaxID=551990 RepID=A0A1B9DP07_9FLAO|nr:hypothetical protein [Flavobacterium glycines]OCB71427.1 hypothetical protein FBGL_09285 [Flavobacterium glycines]GEL10447.1 hypothetical protein FGL01_11860 [Flavobacterium glycines]SDI67723.1 hypothetical protein SAMN05192550_0513 [Flavobacterium glycines]
MNKKILLGILILLIAGIFIYRYTYQDHRNISSEKATYTLTIAVLEKEFAANDSLASAKYQDQTIALSAQITEVDFENKAVILNQKLYAVFDSLPKNIIPGKTLKIKGRFLGYDELLEEFKMDQCTIVNPKN